MVIRRIVADRPPPAPQREAGDVPDWTDLELLNALSARDPRAGLALYDRLIRIVEWTIARVLGERGPDHEDLVQSAFEQIVVTLYRRRFAHDCSLSSWASAVSCHIALNALRSRRRQRWVGSDASGRDLEVPARTDLESQLAARQLLEQIRRELARMNHSRAEVLVLHEVNGLELTEIARVLGISVAAAQSRLSRGRRELLERLDRPQEGKAP